MSNHCPSCGLESGTSCVDDWHTQKGRDPRVDYSKDERPAALGGECSGCLHQPPLHEEWCPRLKLPQPRSERQMQIAQWVKDAFGEEQAASLPHLGIRMMEEAIELAQAAGTDKDMIHKLVDFVYGRPVGGIGNELGGLSVTALALASAAGLDLDAEEANEVRRVLTIPIERFRERNADKNAAGFDGRKKGCVLLEAPHVMPGWGCCQCRVYNSMMRAVCKNCRHTRCDGAR